MKFKQNAELALTNLVTAKLRSFLAVLGILVGTAAVVALMLLGQLATQTALEQFKALGTDLLAVSVTEENSPEGASAQSSKFWLEDINTLRTSLPGVLDVAPYMTLFQEVGFQGKKISAVVIGAEEGLARILHLPLEEGHFISVVDEYEHYCVIGHETANELRKQYGQSIIGQQVWLGDLIYTIIGVTKPVPENPFFNQNINKSVIIPIRGAAVLNANAQINNLIFRLLPNADIDSIVVKTTDIIHQKNPDLKIFTRSAREIIKSMENQGRIFTLLLGLIGGISLLVGGIGVMNVMLVSVTERRREIGIRMAIGAKRKDIRTLFLVESVVLGLLGGTLGVILGLLTVAIIGFLAGWGFRFYLLPPVVGFLVSSATGVFFGFYPAHRASKLDPIETLRHE